MKKRSHTILIDNSLDEDLKGSKKLQYSNENELEDDVFIHDNSIKRNKDDNNLLKGLLEASNEMNKEIDLDYEPRLNLVEVLDEDDEEDEDYLPNVEQEDDNNGDNKSTTEDDQLQDNNNNRLIDIVEDEDDDIVIVRNNINPIHENRVLINEEIDEDDEDEINLDEHIREELRILHEAHEDDSDEEDAVVDSRPPCPNGRNCYRNYPNHFDEFSHSYDLPNYNNIQIERNVNSNIRPQVLDLTDIDDDEIVINPITNNNTDNNPNANMTNNTTNNRTINHIDESNNRRNNTNDTRSLNMTNQRNRIRRNSNNRNNSNNNTNNTNPNNINNNNNTNNHNVLDLTSDVIDLTDDSVTFLPPPRHNNNQRHNRRVFSISSASNQIMDFMGINFVLMSNLFNMRRAQSAFQAQPQRPQRPPRKPSDLVERKKVDGNCPICLDEMTEGPTVCYCRYGCGNNVHTKCFKNWNKDTCVMCREPWN